MPHFLARRNAARIAALLAFVLVAAACQASPSTPPSPPPGPSIHPGPSGGATFTAGELRLLLIDRFGPRWYCDPDMYPVAVANELERAIQRWPELVAEGELLRAVAAKLSIDTTGAVSDAEKLAIYQVWKIAISIPLDPIGEGRYRFDYTAQPVAGAAQGTRTAGTIAADGSIAIEQQAPADEPICPICLARGTLIDTPAGAVAIEDLRLGDPIWTIDRSGHRVAGTIIALGSTVAPVDHRVTRVSLADGRSVLASAGHPLADGRRIGVLALGDVVDGSRVVGLDSSEYGAGQTFDLVASGDTGAYYADGVPMGSTLLSTGS